MEDYIAGRKVDVWKTGISPNNIIFFLFNMCATASVSRIRESIDEERFLTIFSLEHKLFSHLIKHFPPSLPVRYLG